MGDDGQNVWQCSALCWQEAANALLVPVLLFICIITNIEGFSSVQERRRGGAHSKIKGLTGLEGSTIACTLFNGGGHGSCLQCQCCHACADAPVRQCSQCMQCACASLCLHTSARQRHAPSFTSSWPARSFITTSQHKARSYIFFHLCRWPACCPPGRSTHPAPPHFPLRPACRAGGLLASGDAADPLG